MTTFFYEYEYPFLNSVTGINVMTKSTLFPLHLMFLSSDGHPDKISFREIHEKRKKFRVFSKFFVFFFGQKIPITTNKVLINFTKFLKLTRKLDYLWLIVWFDEKCLRLARLKILCVQVLKLWMWTWSWWAKWGNDFSPFR